jgi:hypothetical protein
MKKIRVQPAPIIHPNGTVSVAFLRKEDCDLLEQLRFMTELVADVTHREHEWALNVGFREKIMEYGAEVQEWLVFGDDQTEEYTYSKFENLRREKNPKRGKGRKPRTHRD